MHQTVDHHHATATANAIHSQHIQICPDLLQQIVKVPLVLRRDGHVVRYAAQQIQLLDRDGIDLIQDEDGRNVHTAHDRTKTQ